MGSLSREAKYLRDTFRIQAPVNNKELRLARSVEILKLVSVSFETIPDTTLSALRIKRDTTDSVLDLIYEVVSESKWKEDFVYNPIVMPLRTPGIIYIDIDTATSCTVRLAILYENKVR